MVIKYPLQISAHLCPAVKINGVWISLTDTTFADENRDRCEFTFDFPDGTTYVNDEMRTGAGGSTVEGMFESLLSFLSACGEAVQYEERTGMEAENTALFPRKIAEWCSENLDELDMTRYEIEELGEVT